MEVWEHEGLGWGMDVKNNEKYILVGGSLGVREKPGPWKTPRNPIVEKVPEMAFSCRHIGDYPHCHQTAFFPEYKEARELANW